MASQGESLRKASESRFRLEHGLKIDILAKKLGMRNCFRVNLRNSALGDSQGPL